MNSLLYTMQIWWSPEDDRFVGSMPELYGCMADGETPEICVAALQETARAWMIAAEKIGREIPRPIPPPTGRPKYLKPNPEQFFTEIFKLLKERGE